MDSDLRDIISKSAFEVIEGSFIYAKVSSPPDPSGHFLLAQDKDEITVVTQQDKLGTLDLVEHNKDIYSLIALHVSVPFYSVGFLAAISNAIAKQGMNILIVSTYSKDYTLVREDRLLEAREVLLSLGFKETR